MSHLFRKEVFVAQQNKWTGQVILTRPFSFLFLTFCAFLIALCIIIFLIFGSYTNKTTVEGQLLPTMGVVRVYSSDIGTITHKFVENGNFVKAGEPLFKLSTSRFGEKGNVQAKLAAEANLKKTLALQELERLKRIHQNEQKNVHNNIHRLNNQLENIKQQITGQNRQIRLAEKTLNKNKFLASQGAVSQQDKMTAESHLLEQRSRLESLKLEQNNAIRELDEQKITLSSLPERHKTELSQLNRAITEMNQEILDFDLKSEQTIRASKSGYISTINVDIGQQVEPSKLLLSIVPEQTELVANLYIPSKAVGFIKPKDKVVLRYQAYPYQKFGHATGEIISVARTALGKQELSGLGIIFTNPTLLNEPAYLVKVKLEKQTIKAYGENKPLQIGMILEADILHERKKLYEWVLDPLYSISGKIN
ncbi:TPA: HlyD family efflux transporter periplasmic adaptor subunit [Neisseria meningitidis]|uniref:HlyD family secretion protein n=1 Tax=Neisseria meningitidis TaxID=487 RepID=UPI000BB6039E|nr:HlyD family efflux transporter periplasmic adaptor subunit [Neisseria meningitidis]MBH2268431.1 HlyD family efflux transporter periplasmic adaptor subunit [Neisseria meningitidis]MBH2283483.1 HlyD family efflux transporter periplasmic adaptor subunit [Neisseria meningitidis]MBH2412316.1 HlyD family efflux transporter periplasmic adaptor subunit [Neisseria meningitidis]MBH2431048.1 HlyD family efflux transporter periplasmic adaptor subunit [Neisseria meningitidis]MBH6062508.1 HlyD family eff